MTIDYTLEHGSHPTREAGLCAMEWVAYIAGEEHTDSPKCVDPVLTRFSIGLNDYLPDDLRQRLRPYLTRMIGTAGDGRQEERRYMVADWAIRVAAAEAQDVIKRPHLAEKLRAVPTVKDKASATHAATVAREVRDATATSAASAATSAAYAAASAAYAASDASAADAASSASAADAASSSASAADASSSSASAADASAAYARRAMWEKLLPSALELLDRMLPGEVVELPTESEAIYRELCGSGC